MTGEISGGFGRADSDEDDGPMIPDLDDVQDEDMALQVSISSIFYPRFFANILVPQITYKAEMFGFAILFQLCNFFLAPKFCMKNAHV